MALSSGLATPEPPRKAHGPEVPLCLDLDGTLCRGDLLEESFARLLVTRPWRALLALFALRRGRAAFKAELARTIAGEAFEPVFRSEVLALIEAVRRDEPSRPVILVTAADHSLAEIVARRLPQRIDAVVASDGRVNLKGEAKAARLVERYGHAGFDYVGDSLADLPVWMAARQAFVVAPTARLRARLAERGLVYRTVARRPDLVERLTLWLRALRPRQWAKNLLVFLAPLAAFALGDPAIWPPLLLTAVAFSALASAVYLVNDVADLAADRTHPRKRQRPIAAGFISPARALTVAFILAGIGLAVLGQIAVGLLALGLGYLVSCFFYNALFKHRRWWDIAVLAGLYDVRVIAGAWASAVPLSAWLTVFATASFVSLAALKRALELGVRRRSNGEDARARDYRQGDHRRITGVGLTSAVIAVVTLAIYAIEQAAQAGYRAPPWLLLMALAVALTFARIWWRAMPRVHTSDEDDPIRHTATDPYAWLTFALGVSAWLLAR
ncbi:MAG: UbiA family prenyltransferase [Casimicrobiaceae bacterium]|nr:UbiA family prenyltransferase [Casimicrobiaceae bacterium]